MAVNATRNARIIFSMMVPLTLAAFLMASLVEPSINMGDPDILDIIAIIVVGAGVWMYNWFEEKPQRASIE